MFAVDDDLESSPKFECIDVLPGARRSRAFEAWLRLGAACRKRGNGGLVTDALLAKVLHTWKAPERLQAAADLVAARGGREHGLWTAVPDGWRFHEWEAWQPSEAEAAAERETRSKGAERSRRWRLRKRLGIRDDDTPAVTSRDTVEASRDTSHGDAGDVSRARAPARDARAFPSRPVPSRPVPIPSEAHGETRAAPSTARAGLELVLSGFGERWQRRYSDAWPGVGKHRGRADQIAADVDAGVFPPARLALALDGYFASEEPFVSRVRHNFATFAADPGRWVATRTEPASGDVAAQVARLKGPKPLRPIDPNAPDIFAPSRRTT